MWIIGVVPIVIARVSPNILDYELCMSVVNGNEYALRYVPDEIKPLLPD